MSEMRGHKALRGVRPLLCDVTAPHLCDALAQNGIIREFRKGEMRGRKVQCGVNPLLYDVTLTLLCVVPPPALSSRTLRSRVWRSRFSTFGIVILSAAKNLDSHLEWYPSKHDPHQNCA